MYVCMYVCMYVYSYLYMYVCILIKKYIDYIVHGAFRILQVKISLGFVKISLGFVKILLGFIKFRKSKCQKCKV